MSNGPSKDFIGTQGSFEQLDCPRRAELVSGA